MNILTRLTYIIIAVFITVTIFATLQSTLGNWGVLLGLVINLGTAFKIIQDARKGSIKRIMGLTIIWTIAIIATAITVGIGIASYTLDKIL